MPYTALKIMFPDEGMLGQEAEATHSNESFALCAIVAEVHVWGWIRAWPNSHTASNINVWRFIYALPDQEAATKNTSAEMSARSHAMSVVSLHNA